MNVVCALLSNGGITICIILYEGQVAGSVLYHDWSGEPEISFWLGREFWRKGTAYLHGLVKEVKSVP
jgi:RimJ/RimL family protein N-acetyltransferase